MSTPIDFGREAGLKTFSGIVVDVLNTNFGAITKEPPAIVLNDGLISTPAELGAGIESPIFISATEGKTGFEIGLVFDVKHITALADLMLMGEGESKTELDNDLKDSIMELANQFFGGLVVPMDTQMGKKFQFRVDDVGTSYDFQADTYASLELSGNLSGGFSFRLYADEGFMAIMDSGQEAAPQAMNMDFFATTGGGSGGGSVAMGSNSPNMDMLLDIEIPVSVRMGSAKLFLKDILGLGPGNIVELDQGADAPIDLTVNEKVIARGEVVIVDGYFGFRIKEIISRAERIKKLKD